MKGGVKLVIFLLPRWEKVRMRVKKLLNVLSKITQYTEYLSGTFFIEALF